MPFGLYTVPPTFQHVMQTVLANTLGKFTIVYLDEVILYKKDFNTHFKHLEQILTLIDEARLEIGINM